MTISVSRPAAAQAPGPARRIQVLGWIAFLAVLVAEAVSLWTSPPDRDMGHLQKLMYVHVPAAWMALLAYGLVFVLSLLYLWKRDEGHDLLAAAAAEVGVVMNALALVLGSIWGRPTWGVWWTWDARLTSTAVLLVIFLGYLALRAFTEDPDRRARWSAAVGILGFLNSYIVYMSVRWWRTLHQVQSSPETLDPVYTRGLRMNAIAFLLVLVYFVAKRYRAARLERAAEARIEEAALAGEGVHV